MPDILVQPTAKRAPALSATSDMPETVREAQQPGDFATVMAPPARSTTTTDKDSSASTSSSAAEENADIDDTFAHAELVGALNDRLALAATKPTPKPVVTSEFHGPPPRKEDFDHPSDWDAAITSWAAAKATSAVTAKFTREEAEREAVAEHNRKIADAGRKISTALQARYAAAAKRYPDFVAVVNKEDLSITPTMRDIIVARRDGMDLAYALGKNPREAARIAALPIGDQIFELGKLDKVPPRQARARANASPRNETMEQYAARRNKEIAEQRASRYGVFRK